MQPLADRLRPSTLDDIVGQKHILGEGKPLRKIIESNKIPKLNILWPIRSWQNYFSYIYSKKN